LWLGPCLRRDTKYFPIWISPASRWQMTDSQHTNDDPEILALLDFEAVPRKFEREDGWTPPLQRKFIAHLARTGSPGKACEALGKRRSGIDKLAKLEGAGSFRAAWAKAVELAQERKAARIEASHASNADIKLPFVDHRRKLARPEAPVPATAPAEPRESIPVVCDKCACEGIAGDEKFAGIPDILMFEPVRMPFGDKGWDEERQRAFIAALAVTGSAGAAARSVGRHELGAERLRKMRGSRSFSEAWDAALEIARDRELMRLGGRLEGLAGEGRCDDRYEDNPEQRYEDHRERLLNKLLRLKRRREGERIQAAIENSEERHAG